MIRGRGRSGRGSGRSGRGPSVRPPARPPAPVPVPVPAPAPTTEDDNDDDDNVRAPDPIVSTQLIGDFAAMPLPSAEEEKDMDPDLRMALQLSRNEFLRNQKARQERLEAVAVLEEPIKRIQRIVKLSEESKEEEVILDKLLRFVKEATEEGGSKRGAVIYCSRAHRELLTQYLERAHVSEDDRAKVFKFVC